jgi:hypothetical protein
MIKLNPGLSGYFLAVQPPCNPATIAGESYDFEKLTAEQADKLISLKSPYVAKKEADAPSPVAPVVAAISKKTAE